MSKEHFLGVPMRIWDGISGAAALIGLLALFGGGAFAVFEYVERKEAARAAETLRMIEVWETRGAEKAYLEIAGALEEEVKGVSDTKQPPGDRLATIRDNIARRALKAAGEDAYITVSQFFTRLSLCIQAELCSDTVAMTFFSQTLSDFRYWFADEINRRRKVTSTHGRELDWLLCRFLDMDPGITREHDEIGCAERSK